jgi:hypothetical protein
MVNHTDANSEVCVYWNNMIKCEWIFNSVMEEEE